MSVKIKVSYENDEERERVIRILSPIMGRAKVKSSRQPTTGTRYKTVYIQLSNTAGEDP